MITNKNTLVVETKKEQRSVSICEEKMVMEHSKTRLDVDRKESSASFLNPALSFARRMSLKITGSRGEREERQEDTTMSTKYFADAGYGHRRARRAPRNNSILDHHNYYHRPSISSGAQMSIHLEHGVILSKTEDKRVVWWDILSQGMRYKE